MGAERWWVGVDLGAAVHEVCVLADDRSVVWSKRVEHKGEAIASMIDKLVELAGGKPEQVAVGIETPTSAVVDMLLERGIEVHAINPRQLDRVRDRYSLSGAKDDRRDAFVLADSLRSDPHLYRRVRLGDEKLVELRELSRVHDELTAEENGLSNRVDAELLRYFPELRALGSVQTDLWFWELLTMAPTPAAARALPAAKVRSLLARHNVRRLTTEDVLAVLRGPTVHVAPGVSEAAARHLRMLLPRLRLVREQKRECQREMEALLKALSEPVPGRAEYRDAAILRSLPGVGTIVGATMLAEAWQPLEERDYTRLRTLSGAAPVTRRSGKSIVISMRRAWNPRLRQALYHGARCGMQRDPSLKARYAALRARGHSHGRALRGLADRLLELLVTLLNKRELVDPARRPSAPVASPA